MSQRQPCTLQVRVQTVNCSNGWTFGAGPNLEAATDRARLLERVWARVPGAPRVEVKVLDRSPMPHEMAGLEHTASLAAQLVMDAAHSVATWRCEWSAVKVSRLGSRSGVPAQLAMTGQVLEERVRQVNDLYRESFALERYADQVLPPMAPVP